MEKEDQREINRGIVLAVWGLINVLIVFGCCGYVALTIIELRPYDTTELLWVLGVFVLNSASFVTWDRAVKRYTNVR